MKYQGGKTRIAWEVVDLIQEHRRGRPYLEPFVGGGSVIHRVPHEEGRAACDANPALITMWQELQRGWDPPGRMAKSSWEALRDTQDAQDPQTAFAGFGLSFMGMWFAGFDPRAASTGEAARALQRKRDGYAQKSGRVAPGISGVQFQCLDYRQLQPHDMLVYCDPPYANTAGYAAVGGGRRGEGFDHDEFWATMQLWATSGCTVLVSEYSAPRGIPELWRKTIGGGMARAERTERVFILE